ncbi:MAG: hemerythrin domain-containing protein [Proteiniphilum sp.]|nr:hemerythrin domain-containing protein [Proteiniphilum sp.]MDD3332492.1 hemerythrin domain-containing protein [Proteiniphilum sp.]
MFHTPKTKVRPATKMAELIDANPHLLLMLQHFNIDFRVNDLTVWQLCIRQGISENLFVSIANLYNGFDIRGPQPFTCGDLLLVIDFLKSSHDFYRREKYPQISSYIRQLQENHPVREMKLLEKFFKEYFDEVLEHLDYEDSTAFPYFISLLEGGENDRLGKRYSSKVYGDHHTDIELKLQDLKNLLLMYVDIEGDLELRRKLLFALYELEFDLYIHSLIEEKILIPSGQRIEKEVNV